MWLPVDERAELEEVKCKVYQGDSGKVLDGYVPPFRLLDISMLLRTKFPVPRSFARMRFPCGGKICGED